MSMSGIDEVFWLSGFLLQVLLVGVLAFRKEYRRFPFFLTFLVWSLIEDPVLYRLSQGGTQLLYYQASTISSVMDSFLQVGVLFEIAYRVLTPTQGAMPRRLLLSLGVVLLTGSILVVTWTLHQSSKSEELGIIFVRLRQIAFTFAFLRLGLFAAITGFSQMLGITWKNHVIRLAAGLAFFSAVSVIIQLTISHLPHSNHQTFETNYSLLNRIQVIAYLSALAFWVWAFVQKDAPRREFTPQMQRILVTISQTVRRNRVSLTRSLGHK